MLLQSGEKPTSHLTLSSLHSLAVPVAVTAAGIALDAPWFRQMSVINAYMALLGVKVTWRNTHNIPQQRHVLVSNHVSVGDLLMLFQQPQRYVHLITSALPRQVYGTQNLPAILQPANKDTYLAIAAQQQQQPVPLLQPQQHHQLRVNPLAASSFASAASSSSHHSSSSSSHADSPGYHHQQQQQQSHSASAATDGAAAAAAAAAWESAAGSSVHVFPEGGMTNGSGMMRFSRGFMLFAEQLPVVPVALRIKTAFPEVKCHTLDSPFLANLFWFSFQPWTELEAVVLPPMQLAPGESKAAFVQRVQLAIAQELGVWVADLNFQQKRSMVQQHQRKVKQQARR
jgi:1-acyl-sn-glycerol-3-phosphate acyltransferase